MEINHDVTFDEDVALGKVRDLPIPRKDNDEDAGKQDEPSTDEPMSNIEGPMDPIDPPPGEPSTSRKRPLWLKDTLEDVERDVAPRGTFRESKKPNRYQGYLATMSTIVQSEPCTFEEAVKHQVWKDAMNEKCESIMKNDVWAIFAIREPLFILRNKGKNKLEGFTSLYCVIDFLLVLLLQILLLNTSLFLFSNFRK